MPRRQRGQYPGSAPASVSPVVAIRDGVSPAARHVLRSLVDGTRPGADLVAVGGELTAGLVVAAYAAGLFPMGLGDGGGDPVGWWSPDPRGVLPLDGLRVSRSLRRSSRRFEVRLDTAFEQVVTECANPDRDGAWITSQVKATYLELFAAGFAHSVEVWQGPNLAGGLYGVEVGGLFAGESMFHRVSDASKVALVALVNLMCADGGRGRLLDVQWSTPHLGSLGVVEISRVEYLAKLDLAIRLPGLNWRVCPTKLA